MEARRTGESISKVKTSLNIDTHIPHPCLLMKPTVYNCGNLYSACLRLSRTVNWKRTRARNPINPRHRLSHFPYASPEFGVTILPDGTLSHTEVDWLQCRLSSVSMRLRRPWPPVDALLNMSGLPAVATTHALRRS